MPSERNRNTTREIGRIVSYFSGVAKVRGLPHVFMHELLLDKDGAPAALVIGFDERFVEALFFDETADLGEPVFRSGKPFAVAVSEEVTGRVLDGFGEPRDGSGGVNGGARPVFAPAPPIIAREPVAEPLTTGVKVIDATLSLGRGQRELVIGDRKLGKSTIVEDIVLNQRDAEPPVRCVYVICGGKERKLAELVALFEERGALAYTTIVAATADEPFAAQYLAPFVGCAVGEYFRDRGEDALVVYDDLSHHAKAYRSIALLLERAPGREAYPGDVFSLHAGLLERAAKLSAARGGGSLTALPILETQEGDVTSFIPTNLISITDGQIYLERGLFQKGFLPAVNVGLSVSRVGSQAQPAVLKRVVGGIRLALAEHKELQKLTQLESVVSEQTRENIHRGELTLELLKQDKHVSVSWPEQAVLFHAVERGFFDTLKREQWSGFEKLLRSVMKHRYPQVLEEIEKGTFNDETERKIKEVVEDAEKEFLSP